MKRILSFERGFCACGVGPLHLSILCWATRFIALVGVRGVGVSDPLGRNTNIGFNFDDEVISTFSPLGRTTGYVYDARAQVTTVTDPLGDV